MKKQRKIGLVIGVIAVGGLIWHASQHRPTGPAAGNHIGGEEFFKELGSRFGVQGSGIKDQKSYTDIPHSAFSDPHSPTPPHPNPLPEGEGNVIRVATWNIHGGKGTDGRRDLNRIADLLRSYDFVALQEVHGAGLFGGADQAEWLGRQREMGWLFAPAVRQWYRLESGNGLLSRIPVEFWQRIPLPSYEDYSFRNMILCKVRIPGEQDPGQTVQMLITHLNRRYDADREAQLRIVLSFFLSLREPAVLLGDLNSVAEDPQIRELLENPEVLDPVGKTSSEKTANRIDWILVRGLKCRRAGIVENQASDHPLVWAELETKVLVPTPKRGNELIDSESGGQTFLSVW
jgi:endonuclease/exonuclease/phosphatase family metal-dependent hydrolase